MHADDQPILEQYLAENKLAQVERPVGDDERELEDQHYEEREGDLVLFEVGLDAAVALVRLLRPNKIFAGK